MSELKQAIAAMVDYADQENVARQNIAPNAGCTIDGQFYDVRNLLHLTKVLTARAEAAEAKLADSDRQGVFEALDDYARDNAALKAKLEKAHAALTPFVDFYADALEGFTETWEQRHFDNHIVLGWNNASLTKGAFTQARDALKELDA